MNEDKLCDREDYVVKTKKLSLKTKKETIEPA